MEQPSNTPAKSPRPSASGRSVRDTGEQTEPELDWQERLLPLIVRMVVGLALFFFLASLAQLAYLHVNIQRAPQIDIAALFPESEDGAVAEASPAFKTLAILEAAILERRYHQANVLLMSRVWVRYLGFVTGMILAFVGAVFILGKLREEASELSARGSGAMITLRSTSPGLVMTVLGVILMFVTIVTHHPIETADSTVYLRLAYQNERPAFRSFASEGADEAGETSPSDSVRMPPPDFP